MDAIQKKRWVKISIITVIGMMTGFAYEWFVGCNSGSCMISGNPYISTLYGGVMFFLIYTLFEKNPDRR